MAWHGMACSWLWSTSLMPAAFWDAQHLAGHEQTWPQQKQQDQSEIFKRSTHGELRKSLSCPSESRCTRQSSGTGLDFCKGNRVKHWPGFQERRTVCHRGGIEKT